MPLVYSTGPLENAVPPTTQSASVWTKVLNNHEHTTITAKIEVFRLDGTKTLLDIGTLTIPPLSSGFFSSTRIANQFEFEVQIQISPSNDSDDVLIGVFGKTATGDLNPSHRLVHKELTRIDELTV
jgi:hypothetical protein